MKFRPSVTLRMVCFVPLIWSIPRSIWRWVFDRKYLNYCANPIFSDVFFLNWELARISTYTYRHTSFMKTHERVKWLLRM